MQRKCTAEQLLDMVKQMVADTSQTTVAKQLGISRQMLNDLLLGRRLMSERIAAALGYEKEVLFRKKAA